MKKLLILFFISSFAFSQTMPINFRLSSESLTKIYDITPASNSISDIVIADDMIWLATSKGLSKSIDNGENWINYYQTEAFGEEGVVGLGFRNNVIWTTTGHTTEASGQNLPEGSGIRYSTDFGETWNKISQPVDDPGDSLITYGINTIRALPVTTTIQNISWDISFTKNTVWIASFAGGLRKSIDMGKTWIRVLLPPDNLDNIHPNDTLNFSLQPVAGNFGPENHLNHRVFSVVGVNDSTLFVGTAGGINKSTDNGISWKKFNHQNQDHPISGNFVTALGYDRVTNTLWGATWKAEDLAENWGVSATTNGGLSWEVFLPGEKAHNFGFKYITNGSGNDESHVFVPTDNGIFRSSDFGNNWISPAVIQDDETKIPLSTDVFYSVNTKKREDLSTDIWIGSDDGLVRLNESGGFWEGEWTVFLTSPPVKEETETFAFPNPFSPNIQSVKIKYVSPRSSVNVTIRIFDFGMNLVRTLIQNAPRVGEQDKIEFWDGRNEVGKIVPNGTYFYRIDIDDDEPLFGKILVLK
ncbi:hypothetical protein ACFLS9_02015 [Bacteroidota bacterium]